MSKAISQSGLLVCQHAGFTVLVACDSRDTCRFPNDLTDMPIYTIWTGHTFDTHSRMDVLQCSAQDFQSGGRVCVALRRGGLFLTRKSAKQNVLHC